MKKFSCDVSKNTACTEKCPLGRNCFSLHLKLNKEKTVHTDIIHSCKYLSTYILEYKGIKVKSAKVTCKYNPSVNFITENS